MNFRILHSVWAQYRGKACFLLRAEGCHTVSLGVGKGQDGGRSLPCALIVLLLFYWMHLAALRCDHSDGHWLERSAEGQRRGEIVSQVLNKCEEFRAEQQPDGSLVGIFTLTFTLTHILTLAFALTHTLILIPTLDSPITLILISTVTLLPTLTLTLIPNSALTHILPCF